MRRRAEAFMRHTSEDFDRGDYDLVLFHVEQAVQLYAKYLLYRKLGDFSKNSLDCRLLKVLVKVYGSRELESITISSIELLYLLEESYITLRYIPESTIPRSQ
ncbi:MAG: HEPN domain-containing protein [Ignisphaera sp.]